MPSEYDTQRANYRYFKTIPTRWMDNDSHQHINNIVYYSFFDTVINEYYFKQGKHDYATADILGFAVETQCQFLKPIRFPDIVEVGLRVGHLGKSSVRSEIGIFKQGDDSAAAFGYFVHVFVDKVDERPTTIVDPLRSALERIVVIRPE